MLRVHPRAALRNGVVLAGILVVAATAPARAQGGVSKYAAESWRKGKEAKDNRQWVECVEHFTEVVEIDSEYLEAYLNLGLCQSELRQWAEAVKTYQKAITLNPPDSVKADVLNRLAFAQASAEQLDDALKTYEQLIELGPGDKNAMVGYAFTLGNKGRVVDAVMAYERALEIDPSDLGIIKTLGEICQRNSMVEQAIAMYERWIQLEPESPDPYRYLGFLLYQTESCARGVEVYEKAIALDSTPAGEPKNAGDVLNLGLLYQKCKQGDKALVRLQQYRGMRPDDTSMVDCHLAFLYEDAGKIEEGIALAREGTHRNPDDHCLQFIWGRLLEKQAVALVAEEKFDDGIATYRKAEAKFQPTLGDPQWGDSAQKQLKRLDQLIKIAEAKKKQAESE